MTYKAGDKVRYTGGCSTFSGVSGGFKPAEGVVVPETESRGSSVTQLRLTTPVQGYPVGSEVGLFTINLELIEPEFGFKDIQKGDKVRRTETWDSGTVKSVEGVVVNLNSAQATTKEGFVVGHYRDEANKHVVLELLDRPEPKHWLNTKPVGVIGLFGMGRYKKVLKKTAEDAWEVTFVANNRSYKLNSEQCRGQWPSLQLQNDDKIEWIK